jgi:hypothetical protein
MQLPSVFKMPSNPFLRFITFSAIFIVGAVSIFAVVQWRTESRAKSFCSSIKIGSNTDGLLKSATDNGARVPKQGWSNGPNSSKMLMVRFTGIDPMYGYYCTIRAKNNVVISKDLDLIDL